MKKLVPLIAAVAIIAVALGWFLRRGPAAGNAVDLVAQFPGAQKMSLSKPPESAFSVEDVQVGDQVHKAIVANRSPARVIWRLDVPQEAWLRTWLAMKPETWDQPGDGVQFRIGVSDGRIYDELLKQSVAPRQVPGDQRWIPVVVDLSAYGGERLDLIFNIDSGSTPNSNDSNDIAAWGAPEVFVR